MDRQIGEPTSQQVNHSTRALDSAGHTQQARPQQGLALVLGKTGADDDIRAAGLVLQRDEDNAAGGTRPLPAGDEAGHPTHRSTARQL